jgi:hypothetical protein
VTVAASFQVIIVGWDSSYEFGQTPGPSTTMESCVLVVPVQVVNSCPPTLQDGWETDGVHEERRYAASER